uniref:Uncharacterized protein n=1 Tax=Timema cristinae TaxID=61476 RepID=A0A7R9DCA5_TIMCR|nr:unnamed protein product [Timema cristinae]
MITSVYCFSESDKDSSRIAQRRDSVRTESSYKLIEENISLINKLRLKEDICRKLENEIEDLEGEIDNVAKTHKEELEKLRIEESDLQMQDEDETEGLKRVSPFIIERVINGAAQTDVSIRKLRDGMLMIQTMTDIQSSRVIAISEILLSNTSNIPVKVKVELYRFLNVCKGVVTCYYLDCVSIEDLEAGLSQEQLVKKLRTRIEELEQWQERLEREGDTLQEPLDEQSLIRPDISLGRALGAPSTPKVGAICYLA